MLLKRFILFSIAVGVLLLFGLGSMILGFELCSPAALPGDEVWSRWQHVYQALQSVFGSAQTLPNLDCFTGSFLWPGTDQNLLSDPSCDLCTCAVICRLACARFVHSSMVVSSMGKAHHHRRRTGSYSRGSAASPASTAWHFSRSIEKIWSGCVDDSGCPWSSPPMHAKASRRCLPGLAVEKRET